MAQYIIQHFDDGKTMNQRTVRYAQGPQKSGLTELDACGR